MDEVHQFQRVLGQVVALGLVRGRLGLHRRGGRLPAGQVHVATDLGHHVALRAGRGSGITPGLGIVGVPGVLPLLLRPVPAGGQVGHDGLHGVGLDHRPVLEPQRGDLAGAAADLVLREEVHGALDVAGAFLAQDDPGQVPAHQRVDLVVGLLQVLGELARVQPGQAEQRRQQVGVAGDLGQALPPGEQRLVVHDERHVRGLLIHAVPLLVHAAVRAEQVPVVGGEEDDRVLRHVRVRVQRVEHPLDLVVHVLLELVVEAPVLLEVRHRLENLRVLLHVVRLAVGLGGEVLAGGRRVLRGIEQLRGHLAALELAGRFQLEFCSVYAPHTVTSWGFT